VILQNRPNRDGNHSFYLPSQDSASVNMTVGREVRPETELNEGKRYEQNSQDSGRSCHDWVSGWHDAHHGTCRARAYRRRTLGMYFRCISIVRVFNP
jgi:hypothetical protein